MEDESENHQQIYDSIEKGDVTTLKTLLEPPMTVDTIVFFFSNLQLCNIYVLNGCPSTRKPPLLVVAAAFSQLDIVKYLLMNGANPNICDVCLFLTESFYFSHRVPSLFIKYVVF